MTNQTPDTTKLLPKPARIRRWKRKPVMSPEAAILAALKDVAGYGPPTGAKLVPYERYRRTP